MSYFSTKKLVCESLSLYYLSYQKPIPWLATYFLQFFHAIKEAHLYPYLPGHIARSSMIIDPRLFFLSFETEESRHCLGARRLWDEHRSSVEQESWKTLPTHHTTNPTQERIHPVLLHPTSVEYLERTICAHAKFLGSLVFLLCTRVLCRYSSGVGVCFPCTQVLCHYSSGVGAFFPCTDLVFVRRGCGCTVLVSLPCVRDVSFISDHVYRSVFNLIVRARNVNSYVVSFHVSVCSSWLVCGRTLMTFLLL